MFCFSGILHTVGLGNYSYSCLYNEVYINIIFHSLNVYNNH